MIAGATLVTGIGTATVGVALYSFAAGLITAGTLLVAASVGYLRATAPGPTTPRR